MTVDLWMAYSIMLVLMTLTLMKSHSGSAKANNQRCMLPASKQAISIKLATTVGHLYMTLTLLTYVLFGLTILGFFLLWSNQTKR